MPFIILFILWKEHFTLYTAYSFLNYVSIIHSKIAFINIHYGL